MTRLAPRTEAVANPVPVSAAERFGIIERPELAFTPAVATSTTRRRAWRPRNPYFLITYLSTNPTHS